MDSHRAYALTREAIEDGAVERMLARSGLPFRVLSQAELDASLEMTLAACPDGLSRSVWLFAYGSLIWNPTIAYEERRIGIVRGWHRRFCLGAPVGRGTPDRPGLVLGLSRGGSCRGVVYRVAAGEARRELALVWRREMLVGSYVPHWLRAATAAGDVPAIGFTINRQAPNYEPPMPAERLVERLATTAGELGSSADYLFETVEGLELAAVPDPSLVRLAAAVRSRLAARFGEGNGPKDAPGGSVRTSPVALTIPTAS